MDSFKIPEKEIERLKKNYSLCCSDKVGLEQEVNMAWKKSSRVKDIDMENVLEIVRFLTFPCTPVFIGIDFTDTLFTCDQINLCQKSSYSVLHLNGNLTPFHDKRLSKMFRIGIPFLLNTGCLDKKLFSGLSVDLTYDQ